MNISHELAASSEQKLLPERWVTQNESYDKRLTKKLPGIFKLTSQMQFQCCLLKVHKC